MSAGIAIERFVLRAVDLPLRAPFTTARDVERSHAAVVVEAHAEGLRGYGEAPVGRTPSYVAETVDTALLCMRQHLAPPLLAQPIADATEVAARFAGVRGWPAAKAALEAAVLDLLARRAGAPLAQFLGGVRREVPCGTALGLEEKTRTLLRRVEAAVQSGAKRVKLKIAPGRDADVLEAVRERFPGVVLSVDGNEGYGAEHVEQVSQLHRFKLVMVEQPFADTRLDLHAQLAARMRAPVCLDDSIRHLDEAVLAYRLGALGVLNVKAPRMGGLLAGRAAAAWAASVGIPSFVGGMLETGIGKLHNLALATCEGFTLPSDATPSDHHFERDLVHPRVTMEDGLWRAPTAPGIGAEVDVERLGSFPSVEVRRG